MDLLDDGVALAHLLNAGGEHDRHDRGQAFRDDRDREGDGDHEGLDHIRLIDRDLADEHQDAEDDAGDAEHQGDLVQVLLQRRLFLRNVVQHTGDLADLGPVADVLDHAFAAAVLHEGRHKRMILAVGKGRLLVALCGGVLLHRDGFAGQGGLVDLQRACRGKQDVGGHHAACLKDHIVAGDQLFRGDLLLGAVPDDDCGGDAQVFQRLNRLLRRDLLDRPDDTVGDHDDGNDHGIHDLPRREGDSGCDDQQNDQRRSKLGRDDCGKRLLLPL